MNIMPDKTEKFIMQLSRDARRTT